MFSEPSPRDELLFERKGKQTRVKFKATLLTNSGEAAVAAMCRGVGLGMLPSFAAAAEHAAGRIEPVLLDWSLGAGRLFAVYPHRRLVSPKVRAFVEALRAEYGDDPRPGIRGGRPRAKPHRPDHDDLGPARLRHPSRNFQRPSSKVAFSSVQGPNLLASWPPSMTRVVPVM